jgi:hypothetical protein
MPNPAASRCALGLAWRAAGAEQAVERPPPRLGTDVTEVAPAVRGRAPATCRMILDPGGSPGSFS